MIGWRPQYGGGENLEDSLLKANVPGRYSAWDKGETRDDCRSDDDDCGPDVDDNDEPDGYK